MVLLVGALLVLYFIPVRYLLMLWGTNKFFRRILRPHAVPNNEVLDLISRVPDNEMLVRILFTAKFEAVMVMTGLAAFACYLSLLNSWVCGKLT